jgi:hypothetical protein
MSDDRPAGETGDRWLTYAELGDMLGVSAEAARAVARRHKWARQPANAVGRVVRVLVPADRIRAATANGQEKNGHRPNPDAAIGQEIAGRWPSPDVYVNSYALKLVANRQDVTGHWPNPDTANGNATSGQRLNPDSANGQNDIGRWPGPVESGHDHSGGHWPNPDASGRNQLAELREVAEVFMAPVREQLADLKMQLSAERERAEHERERAERAEQRAGEAETRVRELHEKLEAEMAEHRKVVGLLAEQLSARRSWWPWRR